MARSDDSILAGVIMIMFAGRERVVREGIMAVAQLRSVMIPAYPMELLANQRAVALVNDYERRHPTARLWDRRRVLGLHPRLQQLDTSATRRTISGDAGSYLYKLSGLLSTRFNRTVFLDCDVFVLRPSLMQQLLTNALAVADVAMPLDPGRTAPLVISTGATPPPWVAPAVGPPMLCSAVLAYRRSEAVEEFFVGAARRLFHGTHPNVRQGDQEMMWFEWRYGTGSSLRVLALPEETYCPLERRQQATGNWARSSAWRTSWRRGVYPCAAVHGHAYAQDARRSSRPIAPRNAHLDAPSTSEPSSAELTASTIRTIESTGMAAVQPQVGAYHYE